MSTPRGNGTGSSPRLPRTVGDPAPSGEVTRGDLPIVPPVAPCDLSTYLDRARTRLGIQVKEIAFHWKTDHAYVSRILSNRDPMPEHRLMELPEGLRRAVIEEWAADEGLTTGRRADLAKALEAIARLAEGPL